MTKTLTPSMTKRNAHPNYANPERLKRISDAAKQRWSNPAFRERMCEKMSSLGPRPSVRDVQVALNGVLYDTMVAASKASGIPYNTLRRWVHSGKISRTL